MAKEIKKVAIQLSLDVDKQGAVAQVKSVTESMKKILAGFKKSGGTFEVFQNLVSYLGDVEQKILELKNINPIKFDELFGENGGAALNSAIQTQISSTLETAKKLPDIISGIQKKIAGLQGQKSVKIGDIREVGEDIKSLYALMGQKPKIDLDFVGQKGTFDKLDVLSDALKDFQVDWLNFVNTVKNNPNPLSEGNSGEGSGGGNSMTAEIQNQIEALKEQKKLLEERQKIFSKFNDGESSSLDITKKSSKELEDLMAKFKASRESALLAKGTDSYAEKFSEALSYAVKLQDTIANIEAEMDKEDADDNYYAKTSNKISEWYGKNIANNTYLSNLIDDFINSCNNEMSKAINAFFDSALKNINVNITKLENSLKAEGIKGTQKGSQGQSIGSSNAGTVGNGQSVDFTDVTTAIQTATDTIKSESGSIQSKIEAINPSDALNSIQTVLNNIQASVDNFANKDGVDSKQQQIDAMKQNLLELAKIQKDTNNQIINGSYQDQELSGHIFANGKIKVNKGEGGSVPWKKIYELILSEAASTIGDIHTHPFEQIQSTIEKIMNDSFSFAPGDISAYQHDKELNVPITGMLTGDIYRILDISKVSMGQMKQLASALKMYSKEYTKQYPDYVKYREDKGRLFLGKKTNASLSDSHIQSELFEQILLKSLDTAGISRDIFQKYDIKNDEDLTRLATTLVQLGDAAKQVSDPFDRMLTIFGTFKSDIEDSGKVIKDFASGKMSASKFASNMAYGDSEQAWGKFLNADFSSYKVGDSASIQKFKSLLSSSDIKSMSGLDDNTINKMISIMSSQQDQAHKLLGIFDTAEKTGGYMTQLYDSAVAYNKGERSIYDIFNGFSGKYGLRFDKINPNAQDSITTIDYQNSLSPLEQAVNEISSLLSSINSAVNAIQQSTSQTTVQSLDKLKEQILTSPYDGSETQFNSFISKMGNTSQYDPSNATEYYTKQVVQNAGKAIQSLVSELNKINVKGIENIDTAALSDIINKFKSAVSLTHDATQQMDYYQNTYGQTINGAALINPYTNSTVDYADVMNYFGDMLERFTSTDGNDSVANKIVPVIDELKTRLDTSRTAEENHAVDDTAQSQSISEILPLLQNINEALNNLTNIFSSGELRVQQVDQNNNNVNMQTANNNQQNISDNANVSVANTPDIASLQNEQQTLLSLEQMVLRVKDAVDAKTQAFANEKAQVEAGITSEIEILKGFEDVVIRVKDTIMSISAELGTVQSVSLVQNVEQEIANCDTLKAKIIEVRDAINDKTQAFVTEKETVTSVVAQEIDSLAQLKGYIDTISQSVSTLINGKLINMSDKVTSEIDKTKDTDKTKTDKPQVIDSQKEQDTSSKVNLSEDEKLLSNILNEVQKITGIIQEGGALSGIKEPLNNISQKLDRIVNGISDHKSSAKLPSGSANTRLADSKQYDQIKEIALGAVSDRGTESKITGMKALADGLVQVNGYIKTAEGNYENFVVKVNTANEAIGLAFSDNKKLTQQMQAEAAAQEAFSNNFNLVADEFIKYKDSIDQSDQITAKFSNQLQQMENRLATVSNGAELDAWKADWDALTASITEAKQEQEKLALEAQKRKDTGTLNSVGKSATEIYNSLKIDSAKMIPELEKIRKKYFKIVGVIEEYKKKREALTQEEIDGLKQAEAELQKEAQVYVQKMQVEQQKKDAAKNAYGASQVKNIDKKYTQLSGVASGAEFADSATVQVALSNLETSYQRLIDKQQEFAGVDPTAEQKREFARLTDQYNQAHSALDNIIKSSRKLAEKGVGDPYKIVSGTNMADEGVRMQELQNAVNLFSNGSAKIGQFNADFTELSYTVKNADGTFTEFTAVLDSTGTKIVNVAGKAKESTSLFKGAFDSLKKKSKEILTYMVSMGGLSRVFGQIKQGVQYVKEIDSALTELKKVTDETDGTYAKFLKTMAQTGANVGATTSDLINMAANWARLGYNIEQAGDLAKSTAVLLNVSEFTDADKASEALISTIQAYGYAAEDSMHVVDVLNEIGNNFAISSDGIATALQDSASSLMAAGNNLEQSVALVAAAIFYGCSYRNI